MFVEETFASEDEPTVKTPVEVEKVNKLLELALPPATPKRIWLITPLVNPPVEVEYLFPFASKMAFPVTCKYPDSVAFVPEALVKNKLGKRP